MKITLTLHAINDESERDKAGMGIKPRLNSIVAGLCADGIRCEHEEWRPENGESQFNCMVREFETQFKDEMPDFFLSSEDKPKPANKSGKKGSKAVKKNLLAKENEKMAAKAKEKAKEKAKAKAKKKAKKS